MTTKPTIELRKIKELRSLSEETACYTADVYVDGKLFCHVSNHGHGGPDDHRPPQGQHVGFNDRLRALDALIGETFPGFDMKAMGGAGELKQDLEMVCGDLLAKAESERQLTRLLKRTIAYYDPARKSVFTIKGSPKGEHRAHLVTRIMREKPEVKILNNLPLPEALQLFVKAE